MVEEPQVVQNESRSFAAPAGGAPPMSEYKVVSSETKTEQNSDLFAFREAMAEKIAADSVKKDPPKQAIPLALIVGGMALAGLAFIGAALVYSHGVGTPSLPQVFGGKPPAPYMDLGTQRYDQAGLGGRLIIRWSDGGSYQFFLDPLDQDQVEAFRAVVQDPPQAISFNLRLLDVDGKVACQKEIVIPPVSGAGAAADSQAAMQPRTSTGGDMVQNMADRNGQVTEVIASGSLPCSVDAYKSVSTWDFSSSFPGRDNQSAWMKHEEELKKKNAPKSKSSPYGIYTLVRSLPASIEGDDVIVSDNPGKGIVATSQGRIFLVGTDVLTNRALDWQSFPASVHFRCEKTASCVVTRLNSRTAVHARLLR